MLACCKTVTWPENWVEREQDKTWCQIIETRTEKKFIQKHFFEKKQEKNLVFLCNSCNAGIISHSAYYTKCTHKTTILKQQQ